LQQVTTGTAADFEDPLTRVLSKFGGLVEPSIVAITLLFGVVERGVVPMRLG
jgi:hypothetical protein